MDRLVAFGHSWVAGEGARDEAHGFVALAAAALGLETDNRGVGGSHSTGTADLVAADPPAGCAVVVVMTGLNDARRAGPDPAVRSAYAHALAGILDTVAVAAPEAVVVAVEQPHLVVYTEHPPHDRGSDAVVDAYGRTLCSVVAERPGVVLAPVAGWDAHRMLAEDTVHPNDAGHACLAAAVVDAVRRARPPAPAAT